MRSQAAFKSWAWVIAAGQTDEPAVFKVDFRVLASLIDTTDTKSGSGEDADRVAQRLTHRGPPTEIAELRRRFVERRHPYANYRRADQLRAAPTWR